MTVKSILKEISSQATIKMLIKFFMLEIASCYSLNAKTALMNAHTDSLSNEREDGYELRIRLSRKKEPFYREHAIPYAKENNYENVNKGRYLKKGALKKVLDSSFENESSFQGAEIKKKKKRFASEDSSSSSYKPTKGYKPMPNEKFSDIRDRKVRKNKECNYPSSGYGHAYCKDDKLVGEHYDLTNRRGPYRVNAHFESPSKVILPKRHNFYHPSEYKDMLMAQRAGIESHDLLIKRMRKNYPLEKCKTQISAGMNGVDRFRTPADQFHEI